MHVPPLFHAVDLQTHVNVEFLYSESAPLHSVHIVALVHAVQLLLQTTYVFKRNIFCFIL
jgi:hypothetical protein